jgi:hypothetical protein
VLVVHIKIKNINENKMVSSNLIEMMRYNEFPFFKMKIILNGVKIKCATIKNKTTLKKWIHTLDLTEFRVYKLTILYKSQGDYFVDNDLVIYFYKSGQNIYFLERSSQFFTNNKYKIVGDFCIFGRSSKKIMIEETNENLHYIQIHCNYNQEMTKTFHSEIYLKTKESVDVSLECKEYLNKKFYFEIVNIVERKDQNIYMYEVNVNIFKSKSWLEKIKNLFV